MPEEDFNTRSKSKSAPAEKMPLQSTGNPGNVESWSLREEQVKRVESLDPCKELDKVQTQDQKIFTVLISAQSQHYTGKPDMPNR